MTKFVVNKPYRDYTNLYFDKGKQFTMKSDAKMPVTDGTAFYKLHYDLALPKIGIVERILIVSDEELEKHFKLI